METATAKAKEPQLRADELEERLIDFAVRIIKLASRLPRNAAGRHIAGQILRSGTSPAPNYGEARGGESSADFTHKLQIVLKELNETSIWLRIIDRSELIRPDARGDHQRERRAVPYLYGIIEDDSSTAKQMTNGKCQNEKWKMICWCHG